jgi:hypothetical protein
VCLCCIQTHYECVVVDQEEQRCRDSYNRAAGPNVNRAVHVGGRNWARSGEAVQARNYFADRCGGMAACELVVGMVMCCVALVLCQWAKQVSRSRTMSVRCSGTICAAMY